MRNTLMTAILLASTPAFAAWPEDISLSKMTTFDGSPVVDSTLLGQTYAQVVRELGVGIGTRSVLPAATLGASGFEFALDNTIAFNQIFSIDGSQPSPWARVHEDELPGTFLNMPSFSFRKGLPFSLEFGVSARYLVLSRQTIFSGFARVALVEGYRPWPDVSVHLGYSHYVGNPELSVGTTDFGVTLGTTLPFGRDKQARASSFSPFADITILFINAVPLVSPELAAEIGAVSYGPRTIDGIAREKAIVIPQFQGGFEIETNGFFVRLSGGWALNTIASANVALGFSY